METEQYNYTGQCDEIEQYDYIEIPFAYDSAQAQIRDCMEFTCQGKRFVTGAFRKGERFAVRFMPGQCGHWEWRNRLTGEQGSFCCVPNTGDSHGVVVTEGYHFRYQDGEKYIPIGTTCYAWVNQTRELQEETVETLRNSPFNKVRMCVFPKSMPYNNNEPEVFPFMRGEDGRWRVDRPVEAFWSNLDLRMEQLRSLGIEADLIVFHPYDRWGFAELSQEESMEYLAYCLYRYGAFRNLWWSLANEYETVYAKTMEDWDAYGEFLQNHDIYHHLISIHDIMIVYPKRDWMSHCSIQSGAIDNILTWRREYGMPVIIDECGYEGDLAYGWGNLTAEELVHRFWQSIARGGYCTHGETFHREDEVLWWAKGGTLHGESVSRIAFLKELLYRLPVEWETTDNAFVNPNFDNLDEKAAYQQTMFQKIVERAPEESRRRFMQDTTPMMIEMDDCKLYYCGRCQPRCVQLYLGKDGVYDIEAIDTWNMTMEPVMSGVSGSVSVPLPAREGMALLMKRVS